MNTTRYVYLTTALLCITTAQSAFGMQIAATVAKTGISTICSAAEYLFPAIWMYETVSVTQKAIENHIMMHNHEGHACPCCAIGLHYARAADQIVITALIITATLALNRLTHKYIPSSQTNFYVKNALKLARGAAILPFVLHKNTRCGPHIIERCYKNHIKHS